MKKRDRGRLIGLAVLLVLATVVRQVPHVEAVGGLSLDGKGSGSRIGSSGCSLSELLTTRMAPDVIVGLLVINDTSTMVDGITDTASLNWHFRANETGPTHVQIFFYYAVASTPLSADNLTLTLSSGAVATVCQDFGVAGADTNAPFDPNPALPNKNSGNSTVSSLEYNTSNPYDFLIILEGFCAEGPAGSDNPANFIFVSNGYSVAHAGNCPSNYLQGDAYYEPVSATLSSSTVSWTFDTQSSPFAMIGDAIEASPGPLSVTITAGSNIVDIGQRASFSCAGTGGLSPYGYSWTFGDGSAGSGPNTSHFYHALGTINVICTVVDLLGTSKSSGTQVMVSSDPSIISFAVSPAVLDSGEKVTFSVSTSGGYGALTYSYANLPSGCLSTNESTLSCYPTSSGNYRVTVTVTDRASESANATAFITVGPQRVLGLPQAMGLAVIFGTTVGIGAIAILSVALALRRKKGRRALATA